MHCAVLMPARIITITTVNLSPLIAQSNIDWLIDCPTTVKVHKMPQGLAESSVLKVPIGHGKTWTLVWKPYSCCSWQLFCPKTAWLSWRCSPSVSGMPDASRSSPCCPSGAGLAARCLQKALSHCVAQLRRSRWTCSQTQRHRLVPLQNCKAVMSQAIMSKGEAKQSQAAKFRVPVPLEGIPQA